MRCIFCKQRSEGSTSQEHIVPESLGNKNQVLPAGIVCDSCNNYFSRKVEKRVLESGYFHSLRFTQRLPSKRNRIPVQKALILPSIQVELLHEKDGSHVIVVPPGAWDLVADHEHGKIIFPTSGPKPDERLMSRFIAKIAVEAFAQRLLSNPNFIEDMIDDEQLEPIRRWARYGKSDDKWLVYERRIYDRNRVHISKTGESYQVVHEYDFLITSAHEVYFCVAIFGKEFTINMGGPTVDGYKQWLSEHQDQSPLYLDAPL